ncbi:HNH endonuclease signature motif containing protein [Streptomyces sp. NPDC051742]|uniref:HNH endonuclease signature motif containing protein n=1 Tax=unclassified Streptomyces TaxID=2593676 RepID=UPI00343D16F1
MKNEPTKAERELDRFLSLVSDRQPHWAVKGRAVRLGNNSRLRYTVYASAYEFSGSQLTPQIVFTVRDCGAEKMKLILRALPQYGVTIHAKPLDDSTAQIAFVSRSFPRTVRVRAIDWVEHTYGRLRPLIDTALGALTQSAGAPIVEPTGEASEHPRPGKLCPVCDQALPAGYARHQRCERAAAGAPRVPEPVLPVPRSRYRELVARIERKEIPGQRAQRTSSVPLRRESAKEAVLDRCGGLCENPGCSGTPRDVTDAGKPILEVDHVRPIAEGGRDHPEQMVALCPNCHAVKTRGSTRHELQQTLFKVACTAHQRAMDS